MSKSIIISNISNTSTIIGTVKKNNFQTIVILHNTYKGHEYVDIRLAEKISSSSCRQDEYIFGKKGITVNKKTIDEVITFLKESAKTLKD